MLAVILGLIVLGITAVLRMPVDLLPTFKTPAVPVLTLYPGMPAEVMERDITTRLERWTGQANGIARQESRSMIGVSVLKNCFRPDIDANTAMSQVASAQHVLVTQRNNRCNVGERLLARIQVYKKEGL